MPQLTDTPITDENPEPILAEENRSEIEAAAEVLCQLHSAFSSNATTVRLIIFNFYSFIYFLG